ncbi:hypothetical protein ACFL21_00390 [Patescibacteria group bacterium]
MKKNSLKFVIIILLSLFCNPLNSLATVPDYYIYEGRLLDSGSIPVTSTHSFRFSFWSSIDHIETDIDENGAIDVSSPNYGGWQEVQTITPNSNGVFSIKLGAVNALPNIDYENVKYLQVEIKAAASDDTSYQLMDPTGDNGFDLIDRQSIGSVPYADLSEHSNSSNQEEFVIDNDNTIENDGTGSIKLQFGNTLSKFLAYDTDNGYFLFNDDVSIQGDLIVSGLINGVDLSNLEGSNSTTADSYIINSDGNSITLDSFNLSADIIVSFNDGDTVVVGEDNVQTLTNKTIDGDDNTLHDIDWSSLRTRRKSITLLPEYNNLSIMEDGSDNIATVKQGYDNINYYSYYLLTSGQANLQDLNFIIPIQIPEDFESWQVNPIQIYLKSTTIDPIDNQVDIYVDDTANIDVPLNQGSDLISSIEDTWIEKNISFIGTPTWNPGDIITLKLKLHAKDNNGIYISQIKLNYVGK